MISEQQFKAPCPPQPEPFLFAGSSLLANEYLLDAKQKSFTRRGREAVFLAKFTSPVLGVSLANKGTRSTAFLWTRHSLMLVSAEQSVLPGPRATHLCILAIFFPTDSPAYIPHLSLPDFPGDWMAASSVVPKQSQAIGFYSFTWIAFNAALLSACCPAHLFPRRLCYVAFPLIIFINVQFFSPRLPSFISKVFNHLFSSHLFLIFLTCAIKMPVKYSWRCTDPGSLRSCRWDAYCHVIKRYRQ